MPSLDSLPGDQRAVLQLVLGRGRSYEEIARMLSIDTSAVRARALAALDALGPSTSIPADNQHRISDYLLGQLADDEVPGVHDLLIDSPSDRAWARVVSAELAPLASGPLPEIPTERSGSAAATPAAPPAEEPAPPDEPPMYSPPGMESQAREGAERAGPAHEPRPPERPRRPEPSLARAFTPAPAAAEESAGGAGTPPGEGAPKRGRGDGRRSSRRGGIIVIALAVIIVIAVLAVVLTSGGSSRKPAVASTSTTTSSTPAASGSSTPTTTTSSATTTGSSSTGARVLAQINLTPPSGSLAPKAAGIAEVLKEGAADGVAIVAQNIPANTTHPPNAYAVWLYNSPADARILGFVNPGVSSTGRLSTAGGLPTNASHYKQLIVTLETTGKPKKPGKIVLQGTLTGLA